jgi:hypothetical protein
MADRPPCPRRPTRRRGILAGTLLAALAPGSAGADAGDGMVIFSELHGLVLSAGQPVAGASVARSWHWSLTDEHGGDRAVTDAQGRFRLPAVARRGWLRRWLPHQPFVEQTIAVTHAGETVTVWMLDRFNYRPGGELGPSLSAAALSVTIELDAPLAHRGPVYGRAAIAPMEGAGQARR